MESNNIITFPINNKNGITIEEIKENLDSVKHMHIQDTLDLISPMMFQNLEIAGFYDLINDTKSLKMCALIIESMKALLCKYYNLDHPFHKFTEELFDEEEDGVGLDLNSIKISVEKIISDINKNERKI